MFGKPKTPIGELKTAVVDEKTRLTTVLRQAKVLTAVLQNEPLKIWLNSELNGYGKDAEIPEYRVLPGQSLGNFSGPFGSGMQNVVLPTVDFPEDLAKFATTVRFTNSARELEDLATNKDEGMRYRWSAEFVALAREYVHMTNGMVLIDAWIPINTFGLEGILDAVRNRLLDFLLELEQVEPDIFSSNEAVERISHDQISQIFNYTINGSNNVVASGKEVHQTASNSISPGDQASFIRQIKSLGISESEAGNLVEAIAADGDTESRELGPRSREWLGKATEKIAEGVWKVTTTAAPQVIIRWLGQYMGWSP